MINWDEPLWEFIWTLTPLAEISLSPEEVRLIHVIFGKGKPSALQVRLALTPLIVDSAGGATSTTGGPKSNTKELQ